MRKKYSKKYNKNKSLKVFRQRKHHKIWKKNKNRIKSLDLFKLNREQKKIAHRARQNNKPPSIELPKNFSFINNPQEVLEFFHCIQKFLKNKISVLLDFENVEIITPDVLALLMAKFSNKEFTYGTKAWINKPLNQELSNLLFESGFYNLLGEKKEKSVHGLLSTKKNTIVDTEVAVSARKLAAQRTYGHDRKIQPLYRTLIECMANTKKHASGNQINMSETWWLSVYNKPGTTITTFTFCDTGVGIFKSSKLATFTKLAIKLGISKHSDILLKIIEGKMESSTGLHYRGKGLPKIYSDYKNNELKRLFIASNNVFADFDNGTFIDLKKQLNGTFLYWEISPN